MLDISRLSALHRMCEIEELRDESTKSKPYHSVTYDASHFRFSFLGVM